MKNNNNSIENDLEFCIDVCGMDDNQVGEMLSVCEKLGGISCEYFAEEFVFVDENGKAEKRWHDDDYLRINWTLN